MKMYFRKLLASKNLFMNKERKDIYVELESARIFQLLWSHIYRCTLGPKKSLPFFQL